MVFEYVCRWCGFKLYVGFKVKSVEDIYKMWGGRCPKCMSPIMQIPQGVIFEPRRRANLTAGANRPTVNLA
mgnify:CR=1 FL=1